MVELKPSPFNPGKAISCSTQQFYHLYKNGKIVDRTLYTKYHVIGEQYKGILVLSKRTIQEIKPRILDSCKKNNHNYPKYTMHEDIVVVSGETGKIILDTGKSYYFDGAPYIISDYIFRYKDTLYNNKGEVIKVFTNIGSIHILKDTLVVLEGHSYHYDTCYIFDKFGKLVNEYK